MGEGSDGGGGGRGEDRVGERVEIQILKTIMCKIIDRRYMSALLLLVRARQSPNNL